MLLLSLFLALHGRLVFTQPYPVPLDFLETDAKQQSEENGSVEQTHIARTFTVTIHGKLSLELAAARRPAPVKMYQYTIFLYPPTRRV